MSRSKRRPLKVITGELQAALKGETHNIIAIGGLLLEAQDALDHGDWLPWLEANFGSSERTDDNDDLFSPKAFKAVLKAAETERIDADRAWAIAHAVKPPPDLAIEEAKAHVWEKQRREIADRLREEAEQQREEAAAIDDILDGPPPELPPPEAITYDPVLPQFDKAVEMLVQVMTKPLIKFTTTAHTLDRIRSIQRFLEAVAEAIERH